ncbi:MAG: alpha/beta hydrolase [Proteobacteria bacterium]|nr:MAG: alpha/beta hydrolase [Pseudomonadota bacterium]
MRLAQALPSLIALGLMTSCKAAPERIQFSNRDKSQVDDGDLGRDKTDQDQVEEDDSGDVKDSDKDSKGSTEQPSKDTPEQDKNDQSKPNPSKSAEELLKESSTKALSDLDTYLKSNKPLADLTKQSFAETALTKEAAEDSRKKIFEALKQRESDSRSKEINSLAVNADGKTMKYLVKTFGAKPEKGHSLYISLHGGGQTSQQENDGQWTNQIELYKPAEGIYIAPRAPTDTWDLWQLPHIDKLIERMIANYIITGQVNPNRIYFMGYSAGGDGLYQLGPRLADRIAAGAMMAGHPGDASPVSLRNIGFSIHVGGNDTAYDRHKLGAEWLQKLKDLRQENPDGYQSFGQIVAGKGHWMDLVDAEAVPWMAGFTRNPFPKKISWHQDDVTHERFYWVKNDKVKAHTELNAEINGQTIKVADNMEGKVFIRLNDGLIDLSKDIVIERNGKKSAALKAKRSIKVIGETLLDRSDPEDVFTVEFEAP